MKRGYIPYDARAADPWFRLLRKYRPVKLRTPAGLLAQAPAARSFEDAARDVLTIRAKNKPL